MLLPRCSKKEIICNYGIGNVVMTKWYSTSKTATNLVTRNCIITRIKGHNQPRKEFKDTVNIWPS